MDKRTTILQQARNEGYREAWSQASMLNHDDAYYRGQQSAWVQAPSRFRWFAFGLALGLLVAWWLA